MSDRPMAAKGLTSYRAQGPFGWIMIGASGHADARREARRSTEHPSNLQIWDGERYVPVLDE